MAKHQYDDEGRCKYCEIAKHRGGTRECPDQ